MRDLKSLTEDVFRARGLSYEHGADGAFRVRHGSTFVIVSVARAGEQEIVRFEAPVAVEVAQLDVHVLADLLAVNNTVFIGAFAYNPDNHSFWFVHNLAASNATPDSIFTALAAVATTADKYDDLVAARLAGKTALSHQARAGG